MKSRSEQLRRQYRIAFAWSVALAAAVHGALLLTSLDSPPDEYAAATHPRPRVFGSNPPRLVQVVFGPPTISVPDEPAWTEPSDRILPADLMTRLPAECADFAWQDQAPLRGGVQLVVDAEGYAHVVRLAGSTGELCGDAVLTKAASALLYHWLPDDRFPAPVDLVQPIAVTAVFD